MSTKFFTNRTDAQSLFKKFEGILQNNNIHFFEALVGYFRASGYFKIQHLLREVSNIRILVGINVDKLTNDFHSKGQLYFENKDLTKETFLKEVKADIASADYKEDIESGIIQFIEDIVSEKIQIRATGSQKLHAKIYIFRPDNFNEHSDGHVITGSSNLTDAGLGTGQNSNYEFNVLLKDYDNVKFALDEFERFWEEATDILPVDIKALKAQIHIKEVTPFELYIKLLIEYFQSAIDKEDVLDEKLPDGYVDLEYQKDAVADGFKRLMKHNGFILADVVGLGKTVVGTRVIKNYIQKNGYNTKVLIVHPPALESNWKSTIRDFRLTNFVEFITNGSLHKVVDADNYHYSNPEYFDLIVIDESHKFRNTTSEQYSFLEIICKTPRKNIGGDSGRKKKVMLLSATPLNNRPDDIANQIYLFQDARHSTLEGESNLQTFFYPKIQAYKKLNKIRDHAELVQKVKDIYLPIRDIIFKELVIRRTRADIKSIDRYRKDMYAQSMSFPKENEPKSVRYKFDDELNKLFFNTVSILIDDLEYFRYRAIEFINDEYKALYDNAKLISQQLSKIMKTQLVKRLESSFYAFKISLRRFQKSNQRMIDMFENDRVFIAPDIDLNKLYDDPKYGEDDIERIILELNEESPNNAVYKSSDFDESFLAGLKLDQKLIDDLVNFWNKIDYDPKWSKFEKELNKTFLNEKNPEKKLVIFSESKETVKYLKTKLEAIGRKDVLDISSTNQKARFNTIQKNFDANLDSNKQSNNYNIIVTTEVLAEGVNLHRSNVVLNYDIPWNATRLMQRIGRVNRLGTNAKEIFVYNFYPTAQSNEQISLNEKALKKLQGFHTAFGEDNKVYHEQEELIENILGNLNKHEEEVSEGLKRLEFIRNFKDKYPEEFTRIKELPLKSRTGRLAAVKNQISMNRFGQELGDTLLCYIRNNKKDAFYLVNDLVCREITFTDAVYFFDAFKKEKAEKIPKKHYSWVNKALDQFNTQTQFNWFSENEIDKTNLAVQERNAVDFIESIMEVRNLTNKDLYTDDFQFLMEIAQNAVYKGVFRKLRIDIANLAREQSRRKKKKVNAPEFKPAELVSKLENIFDKYPLRQIARLERLRKEEADKPVVRSKPMIVLSETFNA